MFFHKLLQRFVPKGFLWRLTSLNMVVIAGAILLSGWAIYHTACFLVGGMGDFSAIRQQQFNATLFQYVLLFAGIAVFFSSIVHFYFTKKLINPVKMLIESTKSLKHGHYPEPLPVSSNDEIGQLISHYNELIEQLKDNDRYRKKLVADISHDLRTPIANLTGYLHALKAGDIEADFRLFEALHGQAEQLTALMEQMEHLNEWNDPVAKASQEKEGVAIKPIVEECVQMFSWRMEEERLNAELDVEDKIVYIHPEGIRQVLNNLIDNAIRYYKGHGPIHISGQKNAEYYDISVTNPGIEIGKDAQSQLFNRFYRVDQSRNRETGGTGLGLAIAKEIVENHGGKMQVHSEAGKNTFSFQIPLK